MIYSSAYIFGQQITAGGTPIQSNIIFDAGVFNMERMKQGFDFVNNTYIAQDIYPSVAYSSGYLPIERGGFATQIAADDGACFVNIGTDRAYLTQGDGYLEHEGNYITPDVDGCDYYLPVVMQKFSEEGYTSFNVTLDYHYSPVQTGGSLFLMQIFGVDGSNLQDMASGGGDCPSTPDFTERTFSMPVGTYSENFVPKYICIRMTSGTYRIKRMWFE